MARPLGDPQDSPQPDRSDTFKMPQSFAQTGQVLGPMARARCPSGPQPSALIPVLPPGEPPTDHSVSAPFEVIRSIDPILNEETLKFPCTADVFLVVKEKFECKYPRYQLVYREAHIELAVHACNVPSVQPELDRLVKETALIHSMKWA